MCPLDCGCTFTLPVVALLTAAVGAAGLGIGYLMGKAKPVTVYTEDYDSGYDAGYEDGMTADYEDAHADGLLDGWDLAVDWFGLTYDELEDDFADAVREFYGEDEADSEGGEA